MEKEARKLLNPQGEKLVEILQASDEEIANSLITELSSQVEMLSEALWTLVNESHGYVSARSIAEARNVLRRVGAKL